MDIDKNAVAYVKQLCANYLGQITFIQKDVFRYRSETGVFDLAWCAGLFDYLNDKMFLRVFVNLLSAVRPGGEVVVGNFSDVNSTRAYMEFAEWSLYHRGKAKLVELALACGLSVERVRTGQELLGVNLFLHICASDG